MLDVLVVSHACFRRINRFVFNLLATDFNLNIEIVAPKTLQIGHQVLMADAEVDGDVKTHFLSVNGTNPRYYKFIGLSDLLKSKQPKVIYLENDPISIQAWRLSQWTTKNKASIVCLSCENLPFDIRSSVERKGWKGIILSMIKNTLMYINRPNINHVFTINDLGTAIFKKNNFKSVSKIPLGFNPSIFHPNPHARKEIRKKLELDQTMTFAYIGRIAPEKGVHILLQSLKKIENLDWYLIIDEFSATKTPYQKEIIALIQKLNLNKKIKYFDANHFEIAKYMNAADVVILPSISTKNSLEQYGRVAPEAMACKKIVVAAHTGALPELIGKAGILFKEGNINQLATILKQMVNNKEQFEHLEEKAHERANEYLSLQTQSNKIFSIINPILRL